MTDQKGDQVALNALVDDCYGGEWEPKIYDTMIDPRDGESAYFIANEFDAAWIKRYLHRNKPVYPLAGTWVEGRLMELIGEAFSSLERQTGNLWHCYTWREKRISSRWGYTGPTAITALAAALRVLKQKEQS